MKVDRLDHLVLTVQNIAATCGFYARALGIEVIEFEQGRKALQIGTQKINLHEVGKEFEPKALYSTPGSADLCFITKVALEDVMTHLHACEIEIVAGPVKRSGARREIHAIYVRDPDMNLVEIANYA